MRVHTNVHSHTGTPRTRILHINLYTQAYRVYTTSLVLEGLGAATAPWQQAPGPRARLQNSFLHTTEARTPGEAADSSAGLGVYRMNPETTDVPGSSKCPHRAGTYEMVPGAAGWGGGAGGTDRGESNRNTNPYGYKCTGKLNIRV